MADDEYLNTVLERGLSSQVHVILSRSMKSLPASVAPIALFLFFSTATTSLIESSAATSPTQAISRSEQAAFEKREAAYRDNNLGVAMLEQYKAREAVE